MFLRNFGFGFSNFLLRPFKFRTYPYLNILIFLIKISFKNFYFKIVSDIVYIIVKSSYFIFGINEYHEYK